MLLYCLQRAATNCSSDKNLDGQQGWKMLLIRADREAEYKELYVRTIQDTCFCWELQRFQGLVTFIASMPSSAVAVIVV